MSTPPPIRSIPAAYDAGEQAEYAAIRSGCAIDRIAPRALLEVAGDAAVGALLRLLRFRLFDPGPADVRAAIVLDGDRITATATVVRRAPDRLMIDCSNPTAERILEDAGVELLEHGDQLVRMRLRGPGLAAVLGGVAPAAGELRTDFAPGGASTLLCGTGADRATLYCGRDGARACWDSLVALGALPVGSTALETVRIEDAEPCLERDFPQPVAPALAGMGEFAPDRRRAGAGRHRARGAVAVRAREAARRGRGGGRGARGRALRAARGPGDRAGDAGSRAGRARGPDRRRRRRAGARRRRCPSGGAARGQRRAELLAKEC